jgi:hypothetical protein
MSDRNQRLIERLAKWITELGAPEYELRCKREVIDTFTVTESAEEIAQDVLAAAESDAEDEGKLRSYTLVGILQDKEQHVCPLKLRIRPLRATSDNIIATLAKQNADLHEVLRKDRQHETDRLLKFVDTVTTQFNRVSTERDKMAERSSEIFERLENLRSKQLDREIAKEKHDKDSEIKDRITDALLPLGVAIAKRFTNAPMLPKINLDEQAIIQICAGMSEKQLDQIRIILGDAWPMFNEYWLRATEKPPVVSVEGFWAVVDTLNPDQQSALTSTLNMGQQAALQELWLSRQREKQHAGSN